MIFVLLQNID